MKTARKALLIALCCVLLVAASVLGTLAYLTDSEAVTNTFTVGKVDITLDEADVDNSTAGDNDRDQANAYKLIPGETYDKDPTVHVAANSEDSWIFVKVENGIADIESDTTIAAQIKDNDWTELQTGIYYKSYTQSTTVTDLVVFENFTVSDDIDNATLDSYENAEIKVTAYAIQMAGFENNAAAAWTAVSEAAAVQG